jgi:NitT/TauT family transport system permease protein
MLKKAICLFYSLKSVFFLLLSWEIIVRFLIPEQTLLPPFSQVLASFWFLIREKVLLTHFIASFMRVTVGFTLGACTGLVLGIAMGCHETIRKNLNPVVHILYPIPAIGWLPLFML